MIYHLVTQEAWQKAFESGVHSPASLSTEGFIHCSTDKQLIASATKHYKQEEELVVLFLVDKKFKDSLKWEPSRGGELFPHIYGPIPLEKVETTRFLVRNAAGEWEMEQS